MIFVTGIYEFKNIILLEEIVDGKNDIHIEYLKVFLCACVQSKN